MDKTLSYQGDYLLGKLQEELVAGVPGLAPAKGELGPEAVFALWGDEQSVTLVVPEEVAEPEVAAVVNAHDPTTPSPAEAEQAEEDANELSIKERLEQQIPVLQAARDAITAQPPTIFGSLTNQERVVLRNLIRNEIQLIRSVLELYEAVE